MRKPTLLFAGLLTGTLFLAGCTSADPTDVTATGSDEAVVSTDTTDSGDTATTVAASTDVLTEVTYAELGVKEVDLAVDESAAVDITLSDSGSTGGDGVTVDGSTVTITAGGVYRLSGTLSEGRVVVATADEDVTLILDGVDITSPDTAALDIEGADEAIVWLAAGSTNTLSDAADATVATEDAEDSAATDTPNATLYSTANLWIAGDGALVVNGVAADGITSKDGLVIAGGDLTVTAADDGIRGKDHLVISAGAVTVEAGGDGLRSDNEDVANEDGEALGVVWIDGGTIDVTAGVDAIDAYRQVAIEGGALALAAEDDGITTEGVLHVSDGTVDISASYEGLEGGVIRLTGGEGSIVASDDGINVNGGTDAAAGAGGGTMPGGGARPGRTQDDATTGDAAADSAATSDTATVATTDGATAATTVAMGPGGGMEQAAEGRYLEITGGTWVIDADGDGLDSNGTATMTGGTVVVSGPTNNGNGAIDVNGTFEITGGSLVAAGSAGMLVSPTATGDQGVLTVSFASAIAEGTVITVSDSDGDHVASFTTSKISQAVVLSVPGLVSGEEYTISTGASVDGEEVSGLVVGGSATGGDELGSLAAD